MKWENEVSFIAYFLLSSSAKNYQSRLMYVKVIARQSIMNFSETQCIWLAAVVCCIPVSTLDTLAPIKGSSIVIAKVIPNELRDLVSDFNSRLNGFTNSRNITATSRLLSVSRLVRYYKLL